MSPQTIGEIALVAVVLGTVGGFLEKKAAPGSTWSKVGNVLASLGADLTFVVKLGGGGQP